MTVAASDAPAGTLWQAPMRAALDQAAIAAAAGDVPVGAVVLDGSGRVIASACNRRERDQDPLAHAEMLALRQASVELSSWRLDDCTMVVTLEPCAMCAGAIAQTRLRRLVFGAFDAKAGAVASVFDVLRDPRLPHRPLVVSGVMSTECEALLTHFFGTHR